MTAPVIRISKPRLSLVSKNGANSKRSLPAPLVPRDVDLRDFRFMPIDIDRLLSSDFHAKASAEVYRAGICLWLRSFHEVPAASIPDNDVQLARLADVGRDLADWQRMKDGALHGWVLCNDGRLYHPVVAVKALQAWIGKLCQRHSGGAGNATRWGASVPPLKHIEKQLLAASRSLRALKKYDGFFEADGGNSAALAKADKALSKIVKQNSDLNMSPTDRNPIATLVGSGSQVESRQLTIKEERGAAKADPLSGASRPAKPRRSKLARDNVPLPDDFELTPDMAEYAAKAGHDGKWLFEKFRTKAQAKGWLYKDWTAAFRNFAATERTFSSANGASHHRPRRAPDV